MSTRLCTQHHISAMAENGSQKITPGSLDVEQQSFDDAAERALVWKIDLRLIPYLTFLYLLSYLDRASIGNAKIEGLAVDLRLTDQQYLWTLTAFFFPYAFFEVPSNILMKSLRPSIWLPSIMIAWGTCMTLMGLVKNFEGLLTARFFLGVAESGLFPGVTYYLSCWYKKREYGVRTAIFASASPCAGAFGGLLAAGLAQLDGAGGLAGWAWIFIPEGLATVVAGLASFWMVPDFPDSATFLTQDERDRTIARLQADSQLSAGHFEAFHMRRLWTAIRDWKTPVAMVIYMGLVGPANGLTLFLPSIIRDLGYTSTHAQLLTVPPYAVSFLVTVAVGLAGDKTGQRGKFAVPCALVAIVGYIMNIIPSSGPGVRYAGVYLAAVGIYPAVANSISWVANNVEGSYKRGIVMAIMISWGNLQGVVISNIYRAKDAPQYVLGHCVVVGYLVIASIASACFSLALAAENRKRERGERDYRIKTGTEEERAEMGDLHPSFRYTI
ncbi:MFS transporter, ACS family, DAL5 transporter family protein [Marchantia polymorpha subsp. ruderalis]|uniref:Major facilitator superfamily (MFS) profile domain-containing protein n=1 Tax=Marchantia polymorpha TaxID=3197 RepID=A0A2R6WLI2_MARPO|nr:hypothetical protein MARPO_0077s0039 [Marchantia polymorpha]BBN18171.1 hypothetical protein Mp_8g00300 [Marchantia polymorpha subsp. ruderalis]|eukprot:PTQ34711.1 hypothetical protein MARPO_0077s0039 [Marchantia polymorpha]